MMILTAKVLICQIVFKWNRSRDTVVPNGTVGSDTVTVAGRLPVMQLMAGSKTTAYYFGGQTP